MDKVNKTTLKAIKEVEEMDKSNSGTTFNNVDELINDIVPGILTIEQIKERIKPVMEKHGIKEVYLFGSYARGEANKKSDVDIYCGSGDVDSLFKAVDFKDELEEVLGKKVDVVTIGSQMHDFFREQLENDKIRII